MSYGWVMPDFSFIANNFFMHKKRSSSMWCTELVWLKKMSDEIVPPCDWSLWLLDMKFR